jgi:hypothetical protein
LAFSGYKAREDERAQWGERKKNWGKGTERDEKKKKKKTREKLKKKT